MLMADGFLSQEFLWSSTAEIPSRKQYHIHIWFENTHTHKKNGRTEAAKKEKQKGSIKKKNVDGIDFVKENTSAIWIKKRFRK